MSFKCIQCGYDLTGIARTRRTDIRCPECGVQNALAVDVSCVRCGYDLSGRARSNLHRVTCSECGEEDAVRREPRVPGYFESRLIIMVRVWIYAIPIAIAMAVGIFNGLSAFSSGNRWHAAAGWAWVQATFVNSLVGLFLWQLNKWVPVAWRLPNSNWSRLWMVMSLVIMPLLASACAVAVLAR